MLPIREAWMGTDGHAMFPREVYGFAHRRDAPRVDSAGDISGCDATHQRGILAAILTYVSIEVD
jgi:hypothetical protein